MADHNHDQHQQTNQPGRAGKEQPSMLDAPVQETGSLPTAASAHGDGAHARRGTSETVAPAAAPSTLKPAPAPAA